MTATTTMLQAEPAFSVVAGADGLAILDGSRLQKIDAFSENTYAYAGPLAVPLPDGPSAAVVAGDHIVVAGPGRAALVADCAECSGVALAGGDTIVTTRANHISVCGALIASFCNDFLFHLP